MIIWRLSYIRDIIDIDRIYGTKQQGVDGGKIAKMYDIKKMKKMKMKKENEEFKKMDKTIQRLIEDVW